MAIELRGLPKDELLAAFLERLNIRQVNAAEIFMDVLSVDLYMEIAQGKRFTRVPKDVYLRDIRIQAGKDFMGLYGQSPHSSVNCNQVMTGYVEIYKKTVEDEILGCIKRLCLGIQVMGVNRESCRVLRDFIDRECPLFTVELGFNFVGEPHFVFMYYDLDMYGESV